MIFTRDLYEAVPSLDQGQLSHWRKHGVLDCVTIVPAAGTGRHAIYSDEAVDVVRVIGAVRRAVSQGRARMGGAMSVHVYRQIAEAVVAGETSIELAPHVRISWDGLL